MARGSSSLWCLALASTLCGLVAAQNTTSSTTQQGPATFPPTPAPFYPQVPMCFALSDEQCPGKVDCDITSKAQGELREAFAKVLGTNGDKVAVDGRCTKRNACKAGCAVVFQPYAAVNEQTLSVCDKNPQAPSCSALADVGLQYSSAARTGDDTPAAEDDGSDMTWLWVILATVGGTCVASAMVAMFMSRRAKDAKTCELLTNDETTSAPATDTESYQELSNKDIPVIMAPATPRVRNMSVPAAVVATPGAGSVPTATPPVVTPPWGRNGSLPPMATPRGGREAMGFYEPLNMVSARRPTSSVMGGALAGAPRHSPPPPALLAPLPQGPPTGGVVVI